MTNLQKKMFIVIAILFAIELSMLGSLTFAQKIEPNQLNVQYKTLKDEKIPKSMNDVSIVYFTDLQYGKFENKKRANKLFDTIRHLDPDIVIFGGDLFDTSCQMSQQDIDYITNKLSSIQAPLGKFCVLGEKDEANNDVIRSILNQSQFEILENETILLTNEQKDGITLSALSNSPDVSKISISNQQYNLLISHMPDTITNEDLSTKAISLALCGHSHGTQITFPIFGGYKSIDGAKSLNRSHAKRLSFPYIISTGIGCTHTNLRFMAKPEVYYLMLQNK